MRKISLLLLCLFSVAFAYPPLPEARDSEEALFVRRIIDFWRDKEYPFVKTEIYAFLKENPKTPFHDHFYAMLGDIAMHEKVFGDAIELYDEIRSLEVQEHVQSKRWQALYQQQFYTQLYQELSPASAQLSDEGKFYFAEAAFREALTLLDSPEGKEQAKILCEEALPFYTSLREDEQFGSHAKLAIAEIYRLIGQPRKAAALYLEIAEEEENDEILFHAGLMLIQCDTKKAAEIFKELTCIGDKRSEEAAFQWLQLLVKEERWEEIVQERRLFLSRLNEEKLPIAYFYLGMIAFTHEQYHQAVLDLQKSDLSGQNALFALLKSAKESDHVEICEETYQRIKERFPNDTLEASFIRAQAYEKSGDIDFAIALYEELCQNTPETESSQNAFVEKIRLFIQKKNWNDAHASVLAFLDLYPNSERTPEMIRLAIDLTLAQLDEADVYEQLTEDINRGLSAEIFEPNEAREKRLDLAKAYLKLDRVTYALGVLEVMEDPDPLLMTQCYIKEGKSPDLVIIYGEETLQCYPEEKRLHLHLFNAYLKLAKEGQSEALNEKAADHLDMIIDLYPISLENRLWLAHHYAKQENVRAIYLLESLLLTETNFKRFDEEALLLAELYKKRSCSTQAKELLERVIALEATTKPKAELILAGLYRDNHEKENALELYLKLEESVDLSVSYQARLEMARMQFSETPEQSLKKLYGLKVRKTLSNEPLHLEAALDHAELKASLLPVKEQIKGLLTLLLDVKEEFTNRDDIWSKDYHASRELLPEKDEVYQAYMRYLEAKIFLLQSRLTKDKQEAKAKQQAAYALFSSLRQGKYALSRYLIENSTIGMHE